MLRNGLGRSELLLHAVEVLVRKVHRPKGERVALARHVILVADLDLHSAARAPAPVGLVDVKAIAKVLVCHTIAFKAQSHEHDVTSI